MDVTVFSLNVIYKNRWQIRVGLQAIIYSLVWKNLINFMLTEMRHKDNIRYDSTCIKIERAGENLIFRCHTWVVKLF